MAKADFESVDDYLAAQPASARAVLQRARDAIRRAVPAAAEVISYQIIAYCLPAGAVLYLGGWRQHYSLYPATPRVIETFADALTGYQVAKGTIRFPFDQPVPTALIERIARLRAEETTAKAEAKAAARGARRGP